MKLLQKMSMHFNLPNAFTCISALLDWSILCVLRFFIAYIKCCVEKQNLYFKCTTSFYYVPSA